MLRITLLTCMCNLCCSKYDVSRNGCMVSFFTVQTLHRKSWNSGEECWSDITSFCAFVLK